MNNMKSIKVPSNGNNSNNTNSNGNGTKYNQSPNGSPFKSNFMKNCSNGLNETEEL